MTCRVMATIHSVDLHHLKRTIRRQAQSWSNIQHKKWSRRRIYGGNRVGNLMEGSCNKNRNLLVNQAIRILANHSLCPEVRVFTNLSNKRLTCHKVSSTGANTAVRVNYEIECMNLAIRKRLNKNNHKKTFNQFSQWWLIQSPCVNWWLKTTNNTTT